MGESVSNYQRIGVFKFRHIGDVLLMTPALRALREAYPQARITAVVNSQTNAMLEGNPHVDEVLVYDRARKKMPWWRQVAYEIDFFRELRKRRFDLTVNFSWNSRRAWWCSLGCGARTRIAEQSDEWGASDWRGRIFTRLASGRVPEVTHDVERHLKIMDQTLGIASQEQGLVLSVDPAERAWAAETLAPLRPHRIVVVHPVARWLQKCWVPERMAAVIDWLQDQKGCRVVVTSSPDPEELRRTEEIIALSRTRVLDLSGQLSLKRLIGLYAEADFFFGLDTAPMHIAAAVGLPTAALFGPTSPSAWGPWTKQGFTLHRGCACLYQKKQNCDWSQTRACMQAIGLEETQEMLEKLLKQLPSGSSVGKLGMPA